MYWTIVVRVIRVVTRLRAQRDYRAWQCHFRCQYNLQQTTCDGGELAFRGPDSQTSRSMLQCVGGKKRLSTSHRCLIMVHIVTNGSTTVVFFTCALGKQQSQMQADMVEV